MQEIPMQLHLMRSLKGAPISVLLVLWISRQPQSMRWIQRQTGYRDEAVQEALELLGEYHLVNRIGRYAWQFSGNTNQFPLGQAMLEDECDEPAAEIVDTVEDLPLFKSTQKDSGKTGVPDEEGLILAGTPEKPESDSGKTGVPHSSSSRSINLDSSKDLLLARADPGKSGVLEILDRFGVRDPKRRKLANIPGITARIALYHLTTCKDVPLAIYRIEHRWRVPEDWNAPDESPQPPFVPAEQGGQEMPADQVEAFGRALECLRANIPPSKYLTYAASMHLAAPVDAGVIRIAVANSFVIREMEPHRDVLTGFLAAEFGAPVIIDFQIM